MHNGCEDLLLLGLSEDFQKMAAGAGGETLNLRRVKGGEPMADSILGHVEEDAVCDGQCDGEAATSRAHDESNSTRCLLRRRQPLGDGKGRIENHARADTVQDHVAINESRLEVLVFFPQYASELEGSSKCPLKDTLARQNVEASGQKCQGTQSWRRWRADKRVHGRVALRAALGFKFL